MAYPDFYTNFLFILRWVHILAGIIWLGHLYFFNFVNVPFQGALDKELKPKVNPLLLTRALWWFRWAAMVTWGAGLLLLFVKYSVSALWIDEATGIMSHRSMWILFGALLGTIMWLNVWLVIWPAQRQILTWVKQGQSPSEMAALAKRALLFSRINTFLSGPMLFAMIAPNNYSSINFSTLVIVSGIALVTIWWLIRLSGRVGVDL
jgi:uncharacterized membrane protein